MCNVYISSHYIIGMMWRLWKGCKGGFPECCLDSRVSTRRGFSLRCWLRRGLIEVYKIMRSIYRVDSQNIYSRVEMFNTKGHSFMVGGGSLMEMCKADILYR